MEKNLFRIIIFIFLLFLVSPVTIFAKKTLPKKSIPVTNSTNITISPKLRSDRLALIVNFSNLSLAKSVSYNLSYASKGVEQGVVGNINNFTTNTASRELLFGTCSSGVCKYHTNLANMKLVVTTTLKSGAKLSKSYRIKP